MPGVRTHQAERKFAIWFLTSVGGHGPFRGLDAPLALPTLYHELQCPRGSLVLGANLRLKCHRLHREERMAAACDRVIVLYQAAPGLETQAETEGLLVGQSMLQLAGLWFN